MKRQPDRPGAYSVSELAARTGVHLETVRFYERKGLLPEPDRTAGGHRKYTEDDAKRLEFILRAKDVGFTLKEIAVLVSLREADGQDSCAEVMELARRKIDEIDAKVRALHDMREALLHFYSCCPEIDIARCEVLKGISNHDQG